VTTAASVVNQALQEIAGQATVTGTNPAFDGSPAGNAASILYTPCVNLLLREQDWEFARTTAPLVTSGIAPTYPWTFGYLYPADCMRIRSVVPATWDANDPQPVRWSEGEQTIGGVATRVIFCDVATASLTYSTNTVTESEWDAMFQEAMVRLLASELAMAIGGRPDFSKVKLQEAGQIMAAGAGRDS
jgi:hypothetical protein